MNRTIQLALFLASKDRSIALSPTTSSVQLIDEYEPLVDVIPTQFTFLNSRNSSLSKSFATIPQFTSKYTKKRQNKHHKQNFDFTYTYSLLN